MKRKIIFIVGSQNQTLQMHKIANALPDFDCWFSQFYAESKSINWIVKKGWVDFTILGGQFKANSEKYLQENQLQIDYKAEKNSYDLAVLCTDMIVPKKLRAIKTVWVQEGMIDQYTLLSKVVHSLGLPRYLSVGTSLNGSANIANVYCCASEGYKSYLAKKGTNVEKLFVTGIPNFDNIEEFLHNDLPHHNYVLVATSDIRECLRNDDRIGFIKNCVIKAAGRPMIFKLHPNEVYDRAYKEILENTPAGTLVFQNENTNHLIANCTVLITQYSTVAYIGICLDKEVYSYFNINELIKLAPLQNGGNSANNIATICRDFLAFEGQNKDFGKHYQNKSKALENVEN
ncbi:MAG: hypothetical protein V4683_11550 [Bacteroidota bacterium]